jgi:hypothetical protein
MTPIQLYNEFIQGKSLETLGKENGVSKQRISQILKPFKQNIDIRLDRPAKESKTPLYFNWKSTKQRTIFYTRRSQAKKLGIEWTITPSEIEWPEKCPVFNIPLNYEISTGRNDNSPSLDRLDPTKGYTPDNVKIISWRANRIKNNGTAQEHLDIAAYMML